MPITPRNVSLTSVLVINFDFHSVPCTFPMYASLIVLGITAALLFFGNCFELRVIYYRDVMFGVQIPASLRALCFVACQRCGCGGGSPVFFIAEQRVIARAHQPFFPVGDGMLLFSNSRRMATMLLPSRYRS